MGHGTPVRGPAASKYAQTLSITLRGMKWTWASTSPGRPSDCQTAGTSASCTALEAPAQRLLHLALRLALADRLPLVVRLAAAREGELDLGVAVAEVQLQGDQREPALLRLADEPLDLLLVQQQLALTARGVVVPGPLGVLG